MSVLQSTDLTKDQLLALYDELGTWTAVREHLGLTPSTLKTLRERLGCYTPHTNLETKKRSVLDPYLEQIRELAAQGMTCPEIVEALNLPVKEEQVRRFIHKHGIPLLAKRGAQPGEKHRDWKGGRTFDKDGYVLIYMPDHPDARTTGYILEHRWVMEQMMGRRLAPHEVVHHINRDRSDNRPENLEWYPDNKTHLAETLAGKMPNWSEDGVQRIKDGLKRAWCSLRRQQREEA